MSVEVEHNDLDMIHSQQPESTETKPWYRFDDVRMAQGFNMLGIGQGALIMSNIFLATALIYYASEQATCLDSEGEVIDDCANKVYGFKPESLISNIALLSGLLSAFFMPVIGAMIDFTAHRRTVGAYGAVLVILVQITQIGTFENTWFAMALLQALSGFLYQVQVMTTYAYLPDISVTVGQEKMNTFSASFILFQFTSEAAYLIVVIALSMAFGLSDVQTGRMGQTVSAIWLTITFYLGWKWCPSIPASHEKPPGQSLFRAGFMQMYNTARHVRQTYGKGLFWFFGAVVFAESALNAFLVLSVVYLNDHMNMTTTEIGIFFLITLLASLPGTSIASCVTARTDPKQSWRLCIICLTITAVAGCIIVDFAGKSVAFIWAACVGVLVGWYYPAEYVFFSMCLPEGRDTEFAGFFVYCSQILAWAPPLLFTVLVEADVSQTYGVASVSMFFVVAIGILYFAAPWNEILEESGRSTEDCNVDEHAKEDVSSASSLPAQEERSDVNDQ